MKKLFIYSVILIVISACESMENFQENPNKATTGSPSLFLTQIEQDLFTGLISYNEISVASRYFVGFSFHGELYQYYRWTNGTFDEYTHIRNVNEMMKWADDNENYIAIGKLFRSIFFYELTMKFGDVPYHQAMSLIEEGITQPVYDTQKDIFLDILDELDEANTILTEKTGSIDGDVIYNGDLSKWQKFTNSFRLRVLLALSNKVNDSDVNPAQKFAEMMNNPNKYPVFESNADNAQRVGNTVEPHPYFSDQAIISYIGMEKAFIDSLKKRNDPRLKYYAEMTTEAKNLGLSPDDTTAYEGLPGSAPNEENTSNMLVASIPNTSYYFQPDFEPVMYLGYYEVNFLIAEGIARGWWTGGEAKSYYEKGIEASLNYWGIPDEDINQYLAHTAVGFNENQTLEDILLQKYLAGYQNSGWEAFYTQRRTGIPVFDVSGEGVPNHKISLRWRYPENEYLLNTEKIETAVTRQFPDGDNIYAEMWLLQE